MIQKSGLFNVSVLTQSVPFSEFQHFGFQSGRDVDKFAGRDDPRSENGCRYLRENCKALLSGKVTETVDCGTHPSVYRRRNRGRKPDGGPVGYLHLLFRTYQAKTPAQTEARLRVQNLRVFL